MLNASTRTDEQNGLQWQHNEEINTSWGTITERRRFGVVSGVYVCVMHDVTNFCLHRED